MNILGNLVQLIFNVLILITLYYASKEDWEYHRITKKYVLIIYVLVIIYMNLFASATVERSVTFLLTLGIFSGFTFLSRGGFGFGDTLILGALGWYIGDLYFLEYYFLFIAFTALIFGAYFVYTTNKRNGVKGLKTYFGGKTILSIDKVRPGMILSTDYFMKGLTQLEIDDLKKQGFTSLTVKFAYPYIPVILVGFLMYVLWYNFLYL